MEHKIKLIEGIFLKRYKRFLADIQLNNQMITVHVPNTGSLKSCNQPGSPCLLSYHQDSKRKLPYTLEAIKSGETWVGVNTTWPNKLAVECFLAQTLDHWKKFDTYQTEVKLNSESRIDLVLWSSQNFREKKLGPTHFTKQQSLHIVEVKNVSLRENNSAKFPDAVTERGQKHLRELMKLLDLGMTAEMLYVIQRDDCEVFEPAWSIDPHYSKLLVEAKNKGLIITPISFKISEEGLSFLRILPVNLSK